MSVFFDKFYRIFWFIKEKSTFHNSEEEKVLHYNDEFEDMKFLGVLRYIVYPMKQGIKKVSGAIFCCKKKKTNTMKKKEDN